MTILPDLVIVRDRVTAAGPLDVNFHAWTGCRFDGRIGPELRVVP